MKKKRFSFLFIALFSLLLILPTTIIHPTYANPSTAPEILFHSKYQTPLFIDEHWKHPQITDKRTMVWAFLENKKKFFKIRNHINPHFDIVKEERDSLGYTHFRLQQTLNGVNVYGADQTIHVNQQNQITAFLGQFIPDLEKKQIPTTPRLSQQKAKEIVFKDLKIKDPSINPQMNLWIYPYHNNFYLAYEIKISTVKPVPSYWHYYIDAMNGQIIQKYNAIQSVKGEGKGVFGDHKTFEVTCDSSGSPCYLQDQTRGKGIQTYDAQHRDDHRSLPGQLISSPSTTFEEPAGVDAHTNLSKSYDYFKDKFGRDSFDNQGAPIISSVHVGNQWNNAAWNGEQILFGDGDGELFTNFAAGLDVTAHELTHALTEKTAQLRYWGEPGALNESMSDLFAVMIDPDDWFIGEDIYTPTQPGDAIRSMKDPTQFDQPDHYRDRYTGYQDNGGVHINSGIHNKALYLLMDGGEHNGVSVNKIGKEKTAQIYYRTLTSYLTSTSNFSQMKRAAIQATKDLYGNHSSEVTAVQKAYEAVGIK